MKHTSQYPYLRVYHPTQSAYHTDRIERYFTQKSLDIATIVVSMAGLIAAIIFLSTMG